MNIHEATSKDRELWFPLWRKFVEEQYALGGTIVPDRTTWKQFLELYVSYTEGSLFGFILLAESPDGALLGTTMAGEMPAGPHFSTTLGKCAMVWGIYTIPEYRRQGVSKALMTRGKELCSDLGFQTVVSEVLPLEHLKKNAASVQAEPISLTVAHRLEKK